MFKEKFLSPKFLKILFALLIVALLIAISRKGYGFGQWLKSVLN